MSNYADYIHNLEHTELISECINQKKRADEFLKAEQDLSRAYLRLRNLIPGAFDTPYAPTAEVIWAHTEACLNKLRATSVTRMVTEFHQAFRREIGHVPQLLTDNIQILRLRLINDELGEYVEAVIRDDIVGCADALADLMYVVIGAAVAHGFRRFDEMFAEVHRSNMSKLHPDGKPVLREDGKILKGPNYSPPNLGQFL